jgi:hypothetical protein
LVLSVNNLSRIDLSASRQIGSFGVVRLPARRTIDGFRSVAIYCAKGKSWRDAIDQNYLVMEGFCHRMPQMTSIVVTFIVSANFRPPGPIRFDGEDDKRDRPDQSTSKRALPDRPFLIRLKGNS